MRESCKFITLAHEEHTNLCDKHAENYPTQILYLYHIPFSVPQRCLYERVFVYVNHNERLTTTYSNKNYPYRTKQCTFYVCKEHIYALSHSAEPSYST